MSGVWFSDGLMRGFDLREWRVRLGLTQADAAVKFKVSRMTVQNWETDATSIPPPIEAACEILEHEFDKRDEYGPVTLIYTDGPMFVNPYGPNRIARMKREPYQTNADALERVAILWGSDDFHSPLIVSEIGDIVWNAIELQKRMKKKYGQQGPRGSGTWYQVIIEWANKDETTAERNTHHIMNTCVNEYITKGLPAGVTIFRDLSEKNQRVYYFSPAAFALAADEILKTADAVIPCDAPSDLSNLRQVPL
jgi:transcriptional regulator with XRE-family HTH domain